MNLTAGWTQSILAGFKEYSDFQKTFLTSNDIKLVITGELRNIDLSLKTSDQSRTNTDEEFGYIQI